MATTTNYSWTTPDDTALVKDGAAAIRTLGSSVDTTVKNLNPETTLGDLAYRSSTANVKTRLALGTANQVLRVNSGATAPEWATVATGGMTLLSTTTLTGANTAITGINQTYNSLVGIVYGLTNSGGSTNYRVDPNGTNANTHWTGFDSVGATVTTYAYTASWYLSLTGTNPSSADNAWFFRIDDYASPANYKPITFNGVYTTSGGSNAVFAGGGFKDNTAITSLTFTQLATSWTAGTVKLYGVK